MWTHQPGLLNLVLTHHGIPPSSCDDGVDLFIPPTVIGAVPIKVYRLTQIRTDIVHHRDSAGTGPVVLKVDPVTGALFSGIILD